MSAVKAKVKAEAGAGAGAEAHCTSNMSKTVDALEPYPLLSQYPLTAPIKSPMSFQSKHFCPGELPLWRLRYYPKPSDPGKIVYQILVCRLICEMLKIWCMVDDNRTSQHPGSPRKKCTSKKTRVPSIHSAWYDSGLPVHGRSLEKAAISAKTCAYVMVIEVNGNC